MLKISNLHSGYGSIEILKGIDLEIPEGKIVALIGANGAGKSTLLMTLSGILTTQSGTIHFQNQAIHSLTPDKIVQKGLSQVPEGRRIFPHLTVSENLDLGAFTRKDSTEIVRDREKLLDQFPRLKERLHQLAGSLSGGEQQMLAMARALMARPKLLLLDEPSLGLAPKIVDQIFALIQQINQEGMTLFLVEQNAWMALSHANYAYVMETGKVTLKGAGKELLKNPTIRQAYLGE